MATAKDEVKEVVKYIEVERKVVKQDKFNVWGSAPKAEWEYITVPKEDLHGYPYPPISVNQDIFNYDQDRYPSQAFVGTDESGNPRFYVPPVLAGELRRIIDRHHIEEVALLQPKRRMQALRQLAGHPGSTKVPNPEALPGMANPS